MGLRYHLVKVDSCNSFFFRVSRPFLYVIHRDEELRLFEALEECGGTTRILLCGDLTVENEWKIRRLKRLLSLAQCLVVTERPVAGLRITEVICEAHLQGIKVTDLDSAILELSPRIRAQADEVVRMLAQCSTHQDAGLRGYTRVKYALEPWVAAISLILLSPLIALVALAVKITSPGPAFYGQIRVGYRGRPFNIYKFRSMRADAEKKGPVWASANLSDSRLTPIGGFLRATHLDEIPQLWNVLRGELSLIGPRPERPVFVQELSKAIPFFSLRSLVKPGITGWAQIRQGYANSIEDSERKLEFDLFYILKHSPWLDLGILLGTVATLASGGTEGRKRRGREKVRSRFEARRPILSTHPRRNVSVKVKNPREVSTINV